MFSQKPVGIPFIRNYTPNEYGTSPENWTIAQDKRGVMYFGNASGVIEFDGNEWRLIPVSNNSLVRSIAIDSSGIIYVGAVGEFGFMAPGENGKMSYHSLVDKLPPDEREFADVWKIYATSEGIYFQTFTKLIRFSGSVVKIWKPEISFHFSYYINDKLFINEREKGLKCLVNDQLKLVKNGEFSAGLRIYGMFTHKKGKVILATREKGLILMDEMASDSNFKAITSEVNDHLINGQVYGGVRLNKDRYAFATLKEGAFITDLYGNIEQVLNKKTGLQDDIIKFVATDNQNDLWLALGKGISHVEISSPLSFFSDAQGLSGTIQDMVKWKGVLYIASLEGIYTYIKGNFVPVKGITTNSWAFRKFIYKSDTILLASTAAGLFRIDKSEASLIKEGFGHFIVQSSVDPKRIFIAMNNGLSSMRYENKRWIDEDYFNGIEKEIRSALEDKNGNLWLGTPFEGLIKVDFLASKTKQDTLETSWGAPYRIANYDTSQGLPNLKYNIPYPFGDKVIFATTTGILEFNEKENKFFPSGILKENLSQYQIFRFASSDSRSIWMFTVAPSGKKETGHAYLKNDGSYGWYSQPFQKISDREIHSIFPEDEQSTWLGGPDGLLHYNSRIKKDFSQPFYALIRRVITISRKDTVFHGSFYNTIDTSNTMASLQPQNMMPELKYEDDAIKFDFSATSYGGEGNNFFSIYLVGYDTAWSDWTNKTEKEYTNLIEGNYIFRAKAKNIYGTESIEATYAFTILPPWYRTTWAYIAYVIAFIGFVYLIIRLSVRRLVQAKIKLEGIVKERTAEVVEQKHLIEEKQKEIIDSINYAQRIQKALLAGDKLLNENLAQYFVFFQPKDIVSGDFYWATTLNNGQFALVTADSTGHGVPGAIMSMLNISCLNDATAQRLNDPNEILNYARAKIIGHLANDGSAEGGKDGMDCSLVSFDFPNNKMTYAAANNPVWIVRNNEILEFDPDKMPVGKHDRDKTSFTQHLVDLQKNDVVYTLTDGMPDQFGGPKGKKFMYKKLKDLFVSVSGFPMNEQKEKIRAALNEWKGELEQVDDVCIIGVRI